MSPTEKAIRDQGRDEGLEAAAQVIEGRYLHATDQVRGFLTVLVEGIRAMKQQSPKGGEIR